MHSISKNDRYFPYHLLMYLLNNQESTSCFYSNVKITFNNEIIKFVERNEKEIILNFFQIKIQ